MNSPFDLPALIARRTRPESGGAGRVHLVGAGPGDPDLLTLRAARLLAQADVVVYDNLVSPDVMDLVAPGAQRIYAGKQRDRHSMPQESINALLVRLARQGRTVVRLKGGDPFIFGRGGEEMQALAQAGVAVEVVPGITAACGVSCYAGIPLTHRDHAQTCVFVTGHTKAPSGERDGSLPGPDATSRAWTGPAINPQGTTDLDWAALARPRQTVVIYMGLGALDEICTQLIAHGMGAEMPAAVVEKGTTPEQRVVAGNLGNLASLVAAAGLESPCLIIVGEVVRLRDSLAWFGPAQTQAPALAGEALAISA
ncbi:MAG: uroporphyrinogen-III C-methyltransferase [Burkholderiales bacterium]|nr:uroporphyrinogen-III C-methyltransferase [Burkholderiales bacterium]